MQLLIAAFLPHDVLELLSTQVTLHTLFLRIACEKDAKRDLI